MSSNETHFNVLYSHLWLMTTVTTLQFYSSCHSQDIKPIYANIFLNSKMKKLAMILK